MNKLSIVILGVLLTAVNTPAHAFLTNSLEHTPINNNSNQCGDLIRVSSESVFSRMHDDLPFLFSNQICIHSLSAKKSVNVEELDTNENVFLMSKRYETTLKNIDHSVDRINFVKSFLITATKKHFITESFFKGDNSVSVSVWGKNTKGILSGVIIKLLDKNEDIALVKSDSSKLNTSEIKSLVSYVISGKKN